MSMDPSPEPLEGRIDACRSGPGCVPEVALRLSELEKLIDELERLHLEIGRVGMQPAA